MGDRRRQRPGSCAGADPAARRAECNPGGNLDRERRGADAARQAHRPIALIIPSFTYYYLYTDAHLDSELQVYLVTDPSDNGSLIQTGKAPLAAAPYVFPDRHLAPMDAIETYRADAVTRHAKAHPPA